MALRIRKTLITIEVLSDLDRNPSNMEIGDIIEEGDTGGFSIRVLDGGSEILQGDAAIKACQDQATDPDFFAMINENLTDDEPAESIWSEIRDNFEDDGILHIDAWTTEDENDEDGHTIAKINLSTGEVEYLDERARTDESAQETIQWHVDNVRDENQKTLDKMRDENWD